MTSWQTKKLGDVLEKIEGGGTPSKDKKEFWNGSIPWASVKDLTSFNPKKTQDYITEKGLKHSSSRLVKAGTLITPTRMALGFTVRFDVDVAINQDLKALYPKSDTSIGFIQYWFETYRKTIERLGIGSTVSGIQVGELKALKIQVPQRLEQERIVSVLKVWDEYIEKLEQKIALKERLKKGLMQQILTGKHRLPGFNDEWRRVQYGDLCKFQNGFAFSSSDFSQDYGIRLIRNRDLKGGGGDLFYKADSIPEQYLVKNGDILIGMDGDFIAHRWSGDKALLNQRVGRLIDFVDSEPSFLFYRSQRDLKQIENETSSTTVKHLSAREFEKKTLMIPAYEEQIAIGKVLDSSSREIETLRYKKMATIEQKKYLLKNLITGTIRTPKTLMPKGEIV